MPTRRNLSHSKPRQLSFLKEKTFRASLRTEHGGDIHEGRRKLSRPFSPKASIHVVMRASDARGTRSMLHRRNRSRIEKLLYTWAKAKHVKIYRFANVGNHLHLLLKTDRHENLKAFLKTFAGLAARAVTGAKKGIRTGKFWEKTAYSRLIPSGAFKTVYAYLGKNRLEAIGFKGACLRIKADGEAIVVVGEPPDSESREMLEKWILGAPLPSSRSG